MTCEQMIELLPDYFQQRVGNGRRAELEAHLHECSACAAQMQLWKQLGELPEERPSAALKQRFDAMMSVYEEGRWQHDRLRENRRSWLPLNWLRGPVPQFALAAALVIAAFLGGRFTSRPATPSEEYTALRGELSSMKQLVVISMLQQQSASERLQGVTWSYQLQQPDPEIVGALIRSLKSDDSVDVRLAALDSLRRYSQDAQVRRGLSDALTARQSPLVQIALIDALVEMRDREAAAKIQELQKAPQVHPVVRERAQQGLAKLVQG